MEADDIAVGEGGVCKSDNIRFIINVLPGKTRTHWITNICYKQNIFDGQILTPTDLIDIKWGDLDLTTSTTTTTTTTTPDLRLATNQEYKSSELSSTPAESDLYSSETINVSAPLLLIIYEPCDLKWPGITLILGWFVGYYIALGMSFGAYYSSWSLCILYFPPKTKKWKRFWLCWNSHWSYACTLWFLRRKWFTCTSFDLIMTLVTSNDHILLAMHHNQKRWRRNYDSDAEEKYIPWEQRSLPTVRLWVIASKCPVYESSKHIQSSNKHISTRSYSGSCDWKSRGDQWWLLGSFL